jgi:hypothetical protein
LSQRDDRACDTISNNLGAATGSNKPPIADKLIGNRVAILSSSNKNNTLDVGKQDKEVPSDNNNNSKKTDGVKEASEAEAVEIGSRYTISSTEIMVLESFFKWLREFEVDPRRIPLLRCKMMTWVAESKEDQEFSLCQTLIQHMLLALYDALLGNYKEALKHAHVATCIMHDKIDRPEEISDHLSAYAATLWALQANILWRIDAKLYSDEILELTSRVRNVDISVPAAGATISVMKAHFCNQLGQTNYQVTLLQQV